MIIMLAASYREFQQAAQTAMNPPPPPSPVAGVVVPFPVLIPSIETVDLIIELAILAARDTANQLADAFFANPTAEIWRNMGLEPPPATTINRNPPHINTGGIVGAGGMAAGAGIAALQTNDDPGKYAPAPRPASVRTTTEEPNPTGGDPNSVVRHVTEDGKLIKTRHYDQDGNAVRDVHHTDHGNPARHPHVPHWHPWVDGTLVPGGFPMDTWRQSIQ